MKIDAGWHKPILKDPNLPRKFFKNCSGFTFKTGVSDRGSQLFELYEPRTRTLTGPAMRGQ